MEQIRLGGVKLSRDDLGTGGAGTDGRSTGQLGFTQGSQVRLHHELALVLLSQGVRQRLNKASDMGEGEPWMLLAMFGHTFYPLLISHLARCRYAIEGASGQGGQAH